MAEITWGALQRLFDDEPPLKIWREERGLETAELASQARISIERLAELEQALHLATDAEVDRLANVLRVPIEYLSVPQPLAAE